MPNWEGVIASIVTPLKNRGSEADVHKMRGYCDFIVNKGVNGIFALGTTGEGPLLSLAEKKLLAEVVVDQVNKRIPVIVHTGCITTDETIELTRFCKDIQVDAASIVLPYYYGLDDDAIYGHYAEIAYAVPDFPLFAYNIPGATGNNLSPALFEKLVNAVGIVGLKSSSPDLFSFQDYLAVAGNKCAVLIGCDEVMLPALAVGAKGVVSGPASAFPEAYVDIYQAFKNENRDAASRYQEFGYKLALLLTENASISSFKTAIRFRGIDVGSVRKPLRELTDKETETLRKHLSDMGLLS
jgi:4-hydroxy-tetrahydrodipicolinate synthase